MPDSPTTRKLMWDAVFAATLDDLGGELLEGSGFENETSTDFRAKQIEEEQS